MSERPKYQSQIEERIAGFPYGTAFSASDFLDIADANSVSQALFRIKNFYVDPRVASFHAE